jgi:hypothetical protein
MPSPFPGMDPFLEDSEIWSGFHHSLAEEIKGQLNAQIGPKYYANVEIQNVPRETEVDITKPERIRPDVGVFLPLDVVKEPITSIAAVAIAPAPVLRTAVLSVRLRTDYVLLVNRAGFSRVSEIWPLALNEPFPLIPVPLLEPDPDVPLDLGAGLRAVYTRSGYAWRIDYRQPVPPPELRPAIAAYDEELLATQSKA